MFKKMLLSSILFASLAMTASAYTFSPDGEPFTMQLPANWVTSKVELPKDLEHGLNVSFYNNLPDPANRKKHLADWLEDIKLENDYSRVSKDDLFLDGESCVVIRGIHKNGAYQENYIGVLKDGSKVIITFNSDKSDPESILKNSKLFRQIVSTVRWKKPAL